MLTDRVAGAPISWGVCEVDGWGYQLDAERVLEQMHSIGLHATEFGPPGFLPGDVDRLTALLGRHDVRPVGGFLLTVLHDPNQDPMPAFESFTDVCVASGAGVVVLAAHSGVNGYDERPGLDDGEWDVLLDTLDRLHDRALERGVLAVVHPHVGTMVEDGADLDRVLAGSRIGLCLDTGHLIVGGVDPVALARGHTDRVAHVHLKDVDAALAAAVGAGTTTFTEAVRAGLFRPLGDGDADVATLVGVLEDAGYRGWYVLEQDVMLAAEPVGAGPVGDVRRSLEHLRSLVP